MCLRVPLIAVHRSLEVTATAAHRTTVPVLAAAEVLVVTPLGLAVLTTVTSAAAVVAHAVVVVLVLHVRSQVLAGLDVGGVVVCVVAEAGSRVRH